MQITVKIPAVQQGHRPLQGRDRRRAAGVGLECDRQHRRRLAGRSSWLVTSSASAACGLLQHGMLPACRAASLQQNVATQAAIARWPQMAAGACGSPPGCPQMGWYGLRGVRSQVRLTVGAADLIHRSSRHVGERVWFCDASAAHCDALLNAYENPSIHTTEARERITNSDYTFTI